jgi:hypothetical protein
VPIPILVYAFGEHPHRACHGWVRTEYAMNDTVKYRGACECRWSATRCWTDSARAIADVTAHLAPGAAQ